MEDFSRDVVYINVIHRRVISGNGKVVGKEETICCSCDVRGEDGFLIESYCKHTRTLSRNVEFMEAARQTLKKGYSCMETSEEENECFGSWIVNNGKDITVDGHREEVIICTKMEQIDGTAMTKRGKTIA